MSRLVPQFQGCGGWEEILDRVGARLSRSQPHVLLLHSLPAVIYGRAMSLRLRLAAPRLIGPSRAQETARSGVLVVLQLLLLLLARSASGGGLELIVYSHVHSRLVSHHPIQPIPTGTAIYSSSSSILSHLCERLTRQFGIVTLIDLRSSIVSESAK